MVDNRGLSDSDLVVGRNKKKGKIRNEVGKANERAMKQQHAG
jgi:hypothetical protein